MNWYYVSNKQKLLIGLVISLCSVSCSVTMMQKFKNLFFKKRVEEPQLSMQEKVERVVATNLKQHTQLAKKLKSYGKKVIVGGVVLGGALGYALKPLSSFNASIGLSSLLAGGQMIGLYDWSDVPFIKKVMDYTGTKFVAGAIVAISVPTGWLICENLPIVTALLGALLGYYVYKS